MHPFDGLKRPRLLLRAPVIEIMFGPYHVSLSVDYIWMGQLSSCIAWRLP